MCIAFNSFACVCVQHFFVDVFRRKKVCTNLNFTVEFVHLSRRHRHQASTTETNSVHLPQSRTFPHPPHRIYIPAHRSHTIANQLSSYHTRRQSRTHARPRRITIFHVPRRERDTKRDGGPTKIYKTTQTTEKVTDLVLFIYKSVRLAALDKLTTNFPRA